MAAVHMNKKSSQKLMKPPIQCDYSTATSENNPFAHMGFQGARHLIPTRLPSAHGERPVGLRVIDLNKDTIDNIQLLRESLKRLDMSQLNMEGICEDMIQGLVHLERLDLSHNCLTQDSFPENFKELENLFELSVHDNDLTEIPKVMRRLKNLHRLKLSSNKLDKVDGLEKIKKLQILVLDDNLIDFFSQEFFINLKRLETLHISKNSLSAVPADIRNLRLLTDLDLSNNNLSYLPPEVFLLPRLEVLNASSNQINRIPTFNVKSSHKQKLAFIDLSENVLTRFPSHLMFLTDKLDLSSNKIRIIPTSIIDKLDQVPSLKLLLNDNSMTMPPQDICDCGLRAILQYFLEVRTDMKIYQGMKVLILGESGQGKTSLAHTIIDQQARLAENEPTIGMDIYDHTIDLEEGDPLGKNLKLSLWDFSGNTRYMFQHQYFLQQPSLALLVFNMADYDESKFKSRLGSWIDWIISRTNKLVMIPVGTHADKIRPKKREEISRKVCKNIENYISGIRASTAKEIKKIESKDYISPALSEQLKLYLNLTKLETVIYEKIIPVSSKDFTGIKDLESAITSMAENKQVFPNVLSVIPSLWGEVENFIDDRGYAMQIPFMSWDDYSDLVTSKFGMRHLIHAITMYLHDTGKVIWFCNHPSLKNYVFLRPLWLVDIFKAIFRHDVADVDYNIEESFKQHNVTPAKLDKMKKDIIEEGILERDYIKCLWSHHFETDFNRPVIEVLSVLVEHFQIGYAVNTKANRRTSAVSKASSGDKTDTLKPEASRTSSRRESLSTRQGPDSRMETLSVITSKSGAGTQHSDKSDQTNGHPKITRVIIPWLRDVKQPSGFKEDYHTYSSNPSIVAVYRFPKYLPPGIFELLSVFAQKNELELLTLHHWKLGLYARHMQNNIRFYFQRIDHDDGGTCVRTEVRHEENFSETDQEKEMENMWNLMLPFLKGCEQYLSKYAGVRMERYMECPLCHSLSFLGEWLTPKDLQGVPTKTCDVCKEEVATVFLVQPKEKRRVEEYLLQKLLEGAERRRREAAEREKAENGDVITNGDISATNGNVNTTNGDTTVPVTDDKQINSSDNTFKSANSSKTQLEGGKNMERKRSGMNSEKTKAKADKEKMAKNGSHPADINGKNQTRTTSRPKSAEKINDPDRTIIKNDRHLATLKEDKIL